MDCIAASSVSVKKGYAFQIVGTITANNAVRLVGVPRDVGLMKPSVRRK